MIGELLFRFLVGGVVVSMFAVIGELFEPKRFSGIFGAAPSVAIATLGLTFLRHGGPTVATEGGWMVIGGVAMLVYAIVSAALAKREHFPVWLAAGGAWIAWLALAFIAWFALREELLA
ncbi:MAG TPA: DUF3147 family protein [Kofleriaceae bacterium]|nr:DUF3147 family protein [Kofleriaceae bacterium]